MNKQQQLMMDQQKPLPPKEGALFKSILKYYETKQFKKGLKAAEQILKKFPEHGETLSMKGLTLNCLDRKEEAYEFVRNGLRRNLKSHICWHVFGLLHRSEKNYDEAIKCYRNALKNDPENLQILRDLSLLQMQMRDLEGFKNTRHELLNLRPQQRVSWIGLAMAYHLLKNYDVALSMLDSFEDQQSKDMGGKFIDYEDSEMVLYKSSVMIEGGKYDVALKYLDDNEVRVCDKSAFMEAKAALFLKMNRLSEAASLFQTLLKRNPDNFSHYRGYEQARGLVGENGKPVSGGTAAESLSQRIALYEELAETYPRAQPAKLIPLSFIPTGDVFRTKVEIFLKNMLRKGAPSLFNCVKHLYKDTSKLQVIEEICLTYLQELRSEAEKQDQEAPSTELWVLYFLAQHFNYVEHSVLALKFVEEAIVHTPTLIELYMCKADILHKAGDSEGAAAAANEARELDTADRYLNSECAKFMIRAGQCTQATNTVGLFSREGADEVDNLVEMQCMWFQLECGYSFMKEKNYGKALRKFHLIEKHFADITDDQFDFHTYCMRKMTLRSYMKLLKLEDHLREHEFYFQTALGAIRAYIELFDFPELKTGDAGKAAEKEDQESANLSAKELKKLKSKQRRAELRAKNEGAAGAENSETVKQSENQSNGGKKNGKKGSKSQEESDPNGEKLLCTDSPLNEAIKFLIPLKTLCNERIDTHLLAYELYKRRNKYLLCVHALKRAKLIDELHPELHTKVLEFYLLMQKKKDAINSTVRSVIDLELPLLLNKLTPEAYNEAYIDRVKKSTADSMSDPGNVCFEYGRSRAYSFSHISNSQGIESKESFLNRLAGLSLDKRSHPLSHELAYTEVKLKFNPSKKEQIIKDLVKLSIVTVEVLGEKYEKCVDSLSECVSVCKSLRTVFGDNAQADAFRAVCKKYFPFAKVLDSC
eukprot:Nk52_evm3s366 gene=Nk52_evmTU3s366